ncbi:hypothetical protein HNP29_005550 [Pseudomonas alcaligenes]|nr:hypothetical protein [Pseudomonas alcaligenes]
MQSGPAQAGVAGFREARRPWDKKATSPCLKGGGQSAQRAVITASLVIPARSMEAMALATAP